MSAISSVGKIFGMFDKIDDIVYEPLKLVCDTLRQPLKQIDVYNDKKKAEHAQDLQKQLEQFEVDLALEKQRRENQLSIEQRKAEEEINQMILDNDLRRREEMVRLEMQYRKEMADAATQLAQIIANMEVDSRSKIIDLYREKEKDYLNLQFEYQTKMFDTVKNIKELLPNESGNEIIAAEIQTQLKMIAERSTAFTTLMNKDLENIFGIIDGSMKEITGLASKYFQPAAPNQPALTQNIVDANR